MSERKEPLLRLTWWGWAAALVAVAIRVAFVVLPPEIALGSGRRYVQPAVDFLAGRFAAPGTIDQLPGAPLFFAGCFLLWGENLALTAAVQHALGLFSLFLLVLTARRAWGVRAASLAAVLLAAQFVLAFQESFIMSETVAQFFFAAALYLAAELRRHDPARARSWVLAGAVAALAGLTRGEFVVLGPLFAGLLLLPPRPKTRARRAALFFGGWLVLVGAWRVRNQCVGFSGYNPHGMTVLLDSAVPLVRYDLPTQPLVKKIFKEQVEYCKTHGCDPRPTTLDRLQKEHGYGYIEANEMFGEMASEAVLSRPWKFVPIVIENFGVYFKPIPWVWSDTVDQSGVVNAARRQSPADEKFWEFMEDGPQYAGWIPTLLAALFPLALWLARPQTDRWTAWLALAGAVFVAGLASVFRAVARTQAELYPPLCLVAAFTVEVLLDSASRASRARSSPGKAGARSASA